MSTTATSMVAAEATTAGRRRAREAAGQEPERGDEAAECEAWVIVLTLPLCLAGITTSWAIESRAMVTRTPGPAPSP